MTGHHMGSLEDIDEIRVRIIKAIDRPIEQLSIDDICQVASISKQTFYSRFSSKYDIANWYCARFEERTLCQIGRTLTWEEGVLAHFTTISKQSNFLRWTSYNGSKDTGEATKVRRRAAILETLQNHRKVEVDQRLQFLIEAYLDMEIFLCAEWFRVGCNPSADIFTTYYLDCVPAKLYQAMQLPSSEAQQIEKTLEEPFSRFYPSK